MPRGLTFLDGKGKPRRWMPSWHPGQADPAHPGLLPLPDAVQPGPRRAGQGPQGGGLKPGQDFQGLAVSIDPQDDPKTALTNQRRLLRALTDRTAGSMPDDAHWPVSLAGAGA
jgi:hypothetical protein